VSLGGYGDVFLRNVLQSGVIPQISLVMGPCAGGAVYSPAITDFIIMVKNTSHMMITGPDVIKAVTHEEVTAEELGGALTHASRSSVVDFAAEDEEDAIQIARTLLSFIPQSNLEDPPFVPTEDPADRMDPALRDLVPDNPNMPYDIRDLIVLVVDDANFFEVAPLSARNIVVGFARFGGRSVGIVANQPAYRAGQEHGGIITHGAKLLYAYCEATVPRITVITRKAYGGAYVVMSSKHTRGDINLAFPTAELAVMGPDGAVNIVFRKELKAAEDPEARRKELEADYRENFANPYKAAELGYIDEVIRPEETRLKVIQALEMLARKRDTNPPKKHGNIPL